MASPSKSSSSLPGKVVLLKGHAKENLVVIEVRDTPRKRSLEVERIADIGSVLTWPTGEGAEFGIVRLSMLQLITKMFNNLSGVGVPFDIAFLSEAGAEAVMLQGLADTPICLTTEPEMPQDRIAVIADACADPQAINSIMVKLFGDDFILAYSPAA